jgi:hypothetical protein
MLKLDDSFHTRGYYARESSVMRQLLPPPPKRPQKEKAVHPASRQLGLFGSD